MSALVVRPAVRSDYDRWRPLWDGYNAFYGRSGDTALAPEITAATWQRFFDPYEPMFALVAERDGELLGLVHYLLHRSTTSLAPSLYLQDLFTSANARGQGVGRALIEAVYAAADANGTPAVYWLTQDFNQTARRLYDRIGVKSPFIRYNRS